MYASNKGLRAVTAVDGSPVPDFKILGVTIHAVNITRTIQIMDGWIKSGHKDYIVLTGTHGIVEMQKD